MGAVDGGKWRRGCDVAAPVSRCIYPVFWPAILPAPHAAQHGRSENDGLPRLSPHHITALRRHPVGSLRMNVVDGSPRWAYVLFPHMRHWPYFGSVALRKALLDFLSSEGP